MRSSEFQERSASRKSFAGACVVAATMLLGAPAAFAQGNSVPQSFDVVPITITGVTVEEGQLVAHGLVGVNPFRTPLNIAARQPAGDVDALQANCPILDLELGAIDLTLIGLNVQTSPICLAVTAIQGGGLLGDLLCGVANLLSGGASLDDVLVQLEAQGQTALFLNGLTSLLDQVFDNLTSNRVNVAATCEVLSLALGPIDLNLLGLRVELDDCNNGPVTLDITAIQGGGLLGDLLCSLSNVLDTRRPPATAIQTLLWRITGLLGPLVG